MDEPCPLPETVKTKLVGDFSSIHSIRQILLVGEHEEKGITELIFVEDPLKLLTSFRDTLPIVGVNNINDTLGVLVVCALVRGDAQAKNS